SGAAKIDNIAVRRSRESCADGTVVPTFTPGPFDYTVAPGGSYSVRVLVGNAGCNDVQIYGASTQPAGKLRVVTPTSFPQVVRTPGDSSGRIITTGAAPPGPGVTDSFTLVINTNLSTGATLIPVTVHTTQ